MDSNELRDLGKQIAKDIAAGLMAATAAGAKEFCREMADAARSAESDNLLDLAERVEQEKAELRQQIEAASGLKRLALARRLAAVEAAEQRMCAEVEQATVQALPAPEQPTHRRNGRRFVPIANGKHLEG